MAQYLDKKKDLLVFKNFSQSSKTKNKIFKHFVFTCNSNSNPVL